MGELSRRVNILADALDTNPEYSLVLLGMAQESFLDHMLVSRAAIHFKNAGNPEKMHVIRPLILNLELIEWWRQSSQNIHGIPGSLTACLSSWRGKLGLSTKEKEFHDFRALLALELLRELGELRGIRLVTPLIAALREPEAADYSEYLLEQISKKPLGEGNEYIMKRMIRTCCAAMRDEKAVKWTTVLLPKIIHEGKNDVIHWISALLGAAKDPESKGTATFLLEHLERAPRFGIAGARDISNLEHALNWASEDPAREHWARIFPKNIYKREGLNLKINGARTYEGPKFGGQWRKRVRLREMTEFERMQKKPQLNVGI